MKLPSGSTAVALPLSAPSLPRVSTDPKSPARNVRDSSGSIRTTHVSVARRGRLSDHATDATAPESRLLVERMLRPLELDETEIARDIKRLSRVVKKARPKHAFRRYKSSRGWPDPQKHVRTLPRAVGNGRDSGSGSFTNGNDLIRGQLAVICTTFPGFQALFTPACQMIWDCYTSPLDFFGDERRVHYGPRSQARRECPGHHPEDRQPR